MPVARLTVRSGPMACQSASSVSWSCHSSRQPGGDPADLQRGGHVMGRLHLTAQRLAGEDGQHEPGGTFVP